MVPPEAEEETVEDVALGIHVTSSKDKPRLPWHYPHEVNLRRHQTILEGHAVGTGSNKHKPLEQNGFFRKPGFSDESYSISHEPYTEAVLPPDNFSGIQMAGDPKPRQRNKKKPSVDMPLHLARDFEHQLRRTLRIDSYQEWFFATARALVEDVIQEPDTAKDKLQTTLGLLLSGVRAMRDSNQVVQHLLDNLLLMRRDAFLDTVAKDVPAEHIVTLRRHSLADPRFLFDREAIVSARKAMMEARQVAVVNAAAKNSRAPRHSNNSNRQQSFSSGSRGSNRSQSGSPRGGFNNNNNNKSSWKNKGKRSPKPKGSPYHKKGDGNASDK